MRSRGEERREAFERLQVPPAAALTDATVIRIGQLVGAAEVVVGTLQLEGDMLVVSARSIALETGPRQANVTERGPSGGLFAIFERLARQHRPAVADLVGRDSPAASAGRGVRELHQGAARGDARDGHQLPATRRSRPQPRFDRARLALWDVYADQGDQRTRCDAIAAIPPIRPNARRARFLHGLSQLELKRYDEAFATFKALCRGSAHRRPC